MNGSLNVEALRHEVQSRLLRRENVRYHPPVAAGKQLGSGFKDLHRIEVRIHQLCGHFGEKFLVTRTGLAGKIEHFIKAALSKVLRSHCRPQVELNRAVAGAFAECLNHLTTQASALESLQKQLLAADVPAPLALSAATTETGTMPPLKGSFRPIGDTILQRQRDHIPLFEERAPVLIVGEGDTELVDLLQAAGRKGLSLAGCTSGDGAEVSTRLAALACSSLGGIYLAEVVETILPSACLTLLRQAADKLRAGGLLVATACNTLCPEGLGDFWRHPARLRPVPPDLLRFLAGAAGLTFRRFLFCCPTPGVSSATWSSCDLTGAAIKHYRECVLVAEKGEAACV